jgi:hypothetical protein
MCVDLMKSAGYAEAFAPRDSPGVDSNTLQRVGRPIGARPWTPGAGGGGPGGGGSGGGGGGGGGGKPPAPAPGGMPTVGSHQMCGGKGEGCRAVKTPNPCEDAQVRGAGGAQGAGVNGSEALAAVPPPPGLARPEP